MPVTPAPGWLFRRFLDDVLYVDPVPSHQRRGQGNDHHLQGSFPQGAARHVREMRWVIEPADGADVLVIRFRCYLGNVNSACHIPDTTRAQHGSTSISNSNISPRKTAEGADILQRPLVFQNISFFRACSGAKSVAHRGHVLRCVMKYSCPHLHTTWGITLPRGWERGDPLEQHPTSSATKPIRTRRKAPTQGPGMPGPPANMSPQTRP